MTFACLLGTGCNRVFDRQMRQSQRYPNTGRGSEYPFCGPAGLAFYDLSSGPDSVTKRLALLFFILLLFELLPFCYMSFYVADRRFFAADVSNDLYHPSAYYLSAVTAGVSVFAPCFGFRVRVRTCPMICVAPLHAILLAAMAGASAFVPMVRVYHNRVCNSKDV
jgi:hypothetical protein